MPTLLHLVTLRSSGIDAEGLLEGVYDPYVFYRDAYRQRRCTRSTRQPADRGDPGAAGCQRHDDADKLLKEQQHYENKTKTTKPSSPTGH